MLTGLIFGACHPSQLSDWMSLGSQSTFMVTPLSYAGRSGLRASSNLTPAFGLACDGPGMPFFQWARDMRRHAC